MEDTALLQISTLGGLSIRLDGEPVTGLASRKVEALLVYLACAGREYRRDVLAELFWEERTQAQAMSNLRVALSSLRKRLSSYVVITRDTVALNPEAGIRLDVSEVERKLGAGETEEAVALYQGDFLEGFYVRGCPSFEDWAAVERERLHHTVLDVLKGLVASCIEGGQYQQGITHASRMLQMDPLTESAHRQMMLLLAHSGQRGAALAQYETCRRVLAEELGVEPTPETVELYEQIQTGELEVPVPAPQAVVPPRAQAEARLPAFLDAERAEAPRPVFLARERELKRLDGFLQTALAGQGQVVFVTGGPGRGKTALVEEFARRAMAAHPDLLVASAACNAFSGVGDPYLPFREVMGMLTGDVESRWAAGTLSTDHARRLWSALPATVGALLDHGPHLIDILVPGAALLSRAQTLRDCQSPRVSELQEWLERRRAAARGQDQERIFQQVAETLTALSSPHPLLLTLDDLQWADRASVSLLFHVGRQLGQTGGRILILGAYRPEEVALDRAGERHPLQKVLTEFRRHFGDVWLDLAAADEVEGRAFVEAYLDSEPNRLGQEFRAALSERTGGHALFTVELLRAMQARGELVQDAHGVWIVGPALDWETLPTRVEAAIQERIERLDAEARDLLAVASVEGEVFTAQAVAQVQGLSERDVLHTLSRQLGPAGHRLLREAGEVTVNGRFLSRYQFGHALFQAYLYDRLSAGEQRLLHGEIGDALEGLYAHRTDAIAPTLAQHFEAAGDLEKAVAYSERAALLARESHAHETAIEHSRALLGLYRRLGDRAGEAKALRWQGISFFRLFNIIESEACHEEALRIYGELDDALGEALTLNMLGWTHVMAGNHTKAEPYLQEAVDICKKIGAPSVQASALCGLGRLSREYTGDFERVRAYGEEALRLSREAGDRFNAALGEAIVGFALHFLGDYSAAQPHMERSVKTLYEIPGAVDDGALCYVPLGLNGIALGNYPAALACLQESRSTFRELRLNGLDDDASAASTLALLHHQLGEDCTAREYAQWALAIHRKTGYDNRIAEALTRLGHALTALGELTEAAAAYQEALDLRRQMRQRHLAPEPRAGLARVALRLDNPEAALFHVEDILSHLETGSVDGTNEPLRIYLTCYRVLKANDDARAEKLLEEAHDLLQERAAKIDDESLRRSYLENVPAHRELVSEWQAVGRDESART